MPRGRVARWHTFLPGESDFLPGFFAGAFFKIVFWGGSAFALIAGLGGGGAGFFGAALGGAFAGAAFLAGFFAAAGGVRLAGGPRGMNAPVP